MSIKDLFGRKYVPSTTEKEAFDGVESAQNVEAVYKKQSAFVPQVDYSDPQTFARYGSANLYYKSAIERILDFYPYDGSGAEITEFYNKSLDIEKYIFDSRYPRTTGYINISADGWGSTTKLNGYGVASSLEYITFNGGPGVLNETQSLNKLIPDPTNSKFQYNNIYDENIYDNHGLPSDYGDGTRQSNLKSNFSTGVTIEFWAMTGSTPAVMNPLTERQVVFDMWNNNPSASADESYGRIRIELQNSDANNSPFLITVQSGTLSGTVEQFNTSSIGSGLNLNTMESWKHYAFVMETVNSTQLQIKLYVNGELNDTLTGDNSSAPGELASKNMQGRLGGLLTAPTKLAVGGTLPTAYNGGGKLSGSIDEFRFWKTARNAEQIGRYWFDQVRGGVNTDIANASLGMYYKFNEGISQTASLDSVVLDYGGRLCNGAWTGYSSNSRNTGSAIISASAAAFEYRDPIIYASHPDVVTLKSELASLGLYHDTQNSAQFLNLIPSWVVEEVESDGSSNLEQVSHIMGAYFDKLYLQISALPSFRHTQYTSASYKPLPFAQHLPQSLGLYTPEIFVDSTVLEKFANRTNKELFEKDLNDTKNLIYQNLYNNLTTIFKSKGTERGIRSVLRCFNIDDNLVYFNIYSNNETYELNNNLKQTQKRRKMLNMNTASNAKAVMFQAADPAYPSSLSYISGSGELGYEDKYGFTLETSVRFPRYLRNNTTFNRNFITSSLFGMQTVNTGTAVAAIDCTFLTGGQDVANFQVQAIRDSEWSKNVYFKLTSSYDPHPFDALTSSNFYNVYGNEDWNLSVAVKPSNWPYADVLTGAEDYTYDVIFRGFNNKLGTIANSFEVSASVSKEVGQSMLRSWKRVYVGAHSTNLTGSNIYPTDVLFNGTKYWTQYLENVSLRQHAVDRENFGISGSYQNVSALDPLAQTHNTYNFNTLALNWYFGTITGSSADADDLFYSTDLSSGSAFIKDNFGWAGEIAGNIHPGRGYNFPTDSTTVVHQELVNEFKFINPELAVGSEMVNILTEDDELYGTFDEVPNYTYMIEKSLQAALSEEILDYFAGVIDFNNLIGDPVNRYRMEYKGIELLRRIFFERFEDIKTVEMYTEYFRWFDDAIANIIEQIVPASADFVADMYNTVESHVLERNKYQSKFPTLEFRGADPEASLRGINELLASYELDLFGGVEASPRPTNLHKNYWKKRAQPGAQGVGSYEISSGDANIDSQRRKFRNEMWSKRQLSASQIILSDVDGTRYERNQLLASQLGHVARLNTPTIHRTIKGGVNFEPLKNIHYAYVSLYPAGPINTTDGVFVPQNVLYSDLTSMEAIENLEQWEEDGNPGKKRKRYMGVVQGRDYDGGTGYTHTKNTFAFPFNVMSASISGGADVLIRDRATSSITITNLHNDVYGPEMEKPMQGPFTEYAVGGHQSRHVGLNTYNADKGELYNGLDNYTTRPEAWKILLGKRSGCPNPVLESGAIGMAGADYPWPEANEPGETPYPMTSSQKAVYYRGMMAKRPVNIRNIQLRTGSTILGNYEQNYQVVMTNGAYINPRNFIENQPSLPTGAFQNTATSSTQIRTFLSVHRTDDNHFDWVQDYNVSYLTSSGNNKTVITNRFANPGGIDSAAPGYRDFRANEYTPYVSPNYRNLSVLKNSQPPSGTFSEPIGAGTTGIRVFDIHGRDVGLLPHLARHTARFGRDPVALPAIEYTLTSSMYIRSPGVHTYSSSAGLQAWWRLNEDLSSGADAIDSSGNGRDGNPSNPPAFTTTHFPNKFIQTGSCTFDGADDNNNIGAAATWDAIIGKAASGGTEKMSLSAWIRPLSDGENNFGRVIDFGAQDVAIFVGTSGGTVRIYYSAKFTGGTGTWRTDTPITLSEWTHVAVTFDADSDSNNPVIYINGAASALTETSTPSGDYDGITTEVCHIGNSSSGARTFDGQIADVAVWNTILPAADIQAIYQVGTLQVANSITATTVPQPGATYNQLPNFHKTHRNTRSRIKMSSITYTPAGTPLPVYASSSQYDNFNVSYQIPRSTMQYAWITASVTASSIYYDQGYTPKDFLVRGPSSSAGPGTVYVEPISFASASDFGSYATLGTRLFGVGKATAGTSYPGTFIPVDFVGLNTIIYEPISSTTNTVGYPAGVPMAKAGAIFPSAPGGPHTDASTYFNPTMINALADNTPPTIGGATGLNALLTNRHGPYGWPSWKPLRQQNNPILVNEHKTNKLSTMYLGNVQRNFDLPPVSMRGRPVLVNLDFVNSFYTNRTGKVDQFQNATFKTSYNNEMIGFNEWQLDRFVGLSYDSEVTPFEQLVAMKDRNNIKLNWVVYTENILPTNRREFLSASTTRVGYDNQFWRNTQTDRVTQGEGVANSVGAVEYRDWNQYGDPFNSSSSDPGSGSAPAGPGPIRYLTQSIWPLDAPQDFLTRTVPPTIKSTTQTFGIVDLQFYTGSSLITANSAGELQNTYQMCHFTPGADPHWDFDKIQIPLCMRNGALYSRKHMLASPLSIESPNGIRIVDSLDGATKWTSIAVTTGSISRATQIPGMDGRCYRPGTIGVVDETLKPGPYGPRVANVPTGEEGTDYSSYFISPIGTGSGEAVWEAPTQAGYLTMSAGVPGFVSASSKPWYNDYDNFRQDIKTIAKGFVVVPEYRVSDHVEKYLKMGSTNSGDFDMLSIPGTELSSSQQNFYKDYSNSEFLNHFLDIRKMSGLEAKEIKITCEAAIKFNPYKGFYPADRSLELVSQFSKSFAQYTAVSSLNKNGIETVVTGGYIDQYSYVRPIYQTLFAPGILYNSIKSGLAVDYPIVSNGNKMSGMLLQHTAAFDDLLPTDAEVNNWLLSSVQTSGSQYIGLGQDPTAYLAYISGAFFDSRIPFEAIVNPRAYLNNLKIVECEPHPSVSNPYQFTASLNSAPGGSLYNLMASNFVAEVGKFFLKDQQYSRLASNGVNLKKYKFKTGESFGARLRMRTSYDGIRSYEWERGYSGSNLGYSYDGAQAFFKNRVNPGEGDSNCWISGSSYEIPQDPGLNPSFKQNFMMYSRPTSFGPPISGRVFRTGSGGTTGSNPGGTPLADLTAHYNSYALSASTYGVKDALNGYNWAFTPPYYHGESWVDFVFHPRASVDYDLETILQETEVIKRRYEPGSDRNGAGTYGHKYYDGYYLRTLVSDTPLDLTASSTQSVTYAKTFQPYASENINDNAMQIDSCVNLFGIELISKETKDKYGNRKSTQNEVASDRWVIQTKFETPMLNFANASASLPAYSSGSVPRGMWHQFGRQPDSPDKGVFMQIDEIPTSWLKNHYEVVTGSSAYNNYDTSSGPGVYKNMKSFASLMGFDSTNSSTRLGEIAEQQSIKEAVVAIPYVLEGLELDEQQPSGQNAQLRKKFINIPKKRFNSALKNKEGTYGGDSLNTAGASIRKMVDNVEKYVFPPQFDFVNNSNISPIVMYIFEFEYKLDQNDLSYIWQNIAPREYQKMELKAGSVAHALGNTELLTEKNLLANPNLRWMVFKVKERSQAGYEEMITDRMGEPTRQAGFTPWAGMYPRYLRYNWPYDFVSIVESIKLDVDVKYNRSSVNPSLSSNTMSTIGEQNQTLDKKKRHKKQVVLKKK